MTCLYLKFDRTFMFIGLFAFILLGRSFYSFAQSSPFQSDELPIGAVEYETDTSRYFWRRFSVAYWPTVGPDWPGGSNNTHIPENAILVTNPANLSKALKEVLPGQHIVIKSGTYPISGKRLRITNRSPSRHQPITLRALEPGKVTIEFDSIEGLYLNQPYWRISGLRFVGKCLSQSRCEHAIHVVGEASHTIIEHNEFIDFNAAIKVNRDKNAFPDHGVVQNNHFYFTSIRDVTKPVTPINVDHGNNWLISRNIIRDFVKLGGNKISYGAFIKGGAIKGTIENNLVICNTTNQHYPGAQVGLSLGGGGMAQQHRREEIDAETVGATIRNNIVMHCNDVGLYINKGKQATINNNILYNTQGIDIRYSQSDAHIINNILNGKIRLRDNGKAESTANFISSRSFWSGREDIDNWFQSPSIGNFTIKTDSVRKQLHSLASPYRLLPGQENTDFCGNTITTNDRFSGPFKEAKACFQ